MNCLLVMKIKWSLDINTGAVERSEAARAAVYLNYWSVGPVRSAFYRVPYAGYTDTSYAGYSLIAGSLLHYR